MLVGEAAVVRETAPTAGEAALGDPAPAGANGTNATHTDPCPPRALFSLCFALQAADGFGTH